MSKPPLSSRPTPDNPIALHTCPRCGSERIQIETRQQQQADGGWVVVNWFVIGCLDCKAEAEEALSKQRNESVTSILRSSHE